MANKVVLIDAASQQALSTSEGALRTNTFAQTEGTFTSVTSSTATTTNIVTPSDDGSVHVTDIVISGEKQNAGTAEIRITDGTNNITLFKATLTDAPVNMALAISGRMQGWKDARIDLITNSGGDITVTLGYVKEKTGLNFLEWDALR